VVASIEQDDVELVDHGGAGTGVHPVGRVVGEPVAQHVVGELGHLAADDLGPMQPTPGLLVVARRQQADAQPEQLGDGPQPRGVPSGVLLGRRKQMDAPGNGPQHGGQCQHQCRIGELPVVQRHPGAQLRAGREVHLGRTDAGHPAGGFRREGKTVG